NVWRVEDGMISMLAGDVFDSAPVLRRLHVFKTIYAISGMLSLRRFIADLIERRRQARYAFSGGNTPVDPA
ncbi:MAG TPA: hydroxylase, partial [Rhodanobacteraceae bacterium]|nr:hydroxylase [Rhodanobacteraceae bacterium]